MQYLEIPKLSRGQAQALESNHPAPTTKTTTHHRLPHQLTRDSLSLNHPAALLAGEDEKKPPDDSDPLRRTRRPFGGLINDIKRRYPHYLSDFTDGLSSSCLAAAIFMYFAALCTAITFGGLMSDKTHNVIGISETLVSCSCTGVIMALFATQPLVIIGTTGPLLLFDESLYNFCMANGLEFLTMRVYVGAWMGVIALTIACVEGSVLVSDFTSLRSSAWSVFFFNEKLLFFGSNVGLKKLRFSYYCDFCKSFILLLIIY